MQIQVFSVPLSEGEISLLIEALDSHEYWQLSEPHERNDGCSTIADGGNDEVDAVRALIAKLGQSHRDQPPIERGGLWCRLSRTRFRAA